MDLAHTRLLSININLFNKVKPNSEREQTKRLIYHHDLVSLFVPQSMEHRKAIKVCKQRGEMSLRLGGNKAIITL